MHENYGRDLDLNLLRVFVVVADAGSVTGAASRLYLTQPAVSAALKRLQRAVGAPLLARRGRGLELTERGQRLLQSARPHLDGLVTAALSQPAFDAATSTRSLRLGLSDSAEAWMLPPLLHELGTRAPGMQLVVLPVQFRTLRTAFESQRLDVAVTVADDVPAGTRRESLFQARFVVLADSRYVKRGKLTLERYLEHSHVVVSYNGDTRGIVEDVLGVQRRVRCSVASFASLGEIVTGTDLLATVPDTVARQAIRRHRHLRMLPKPFGLRGAPMEMLWSATLEDDPACAFLRELIREVTKTARQKPS
ncbi:MAG TPA: LysR family transcriptional regulator [Polyangiaceae bacterium]|nr:LysR family transcriptional regulator [Polyangiaceae bacterium]